MVIIRGDLRTSIIDCASAPSAKKLLPCNPSASTVFVSVPVVFVSVSVVCFNGAIAFASCGFSLAPT